MPDFILWIEFLATSQWFTEHNEINQLVRIIAFIMDGGSAHTPQSVHCAGDLLTQDRDLCLLLPSSPWISLSSPLPLLVQ